MAVTRITREERRAQTRERLLEAAAEVFRREGFKAGSVERVAEAAGFTKGAVYSNFASKEELFIAMLDNQLEARWLAIEGLINSVLAGEAPVNWQGQIEQTFAEARNWVLLSVEFWGYALRDPLMQDKLAQRFRSGRKYLADAINADATEGRTTRSMNSTRIVTLLLALDTGLLLQHYVDPEEVPAQLYVEALSLLFNGLQPSTITA